MNTKNEDGALSDEELEKAAGGTGAAQKAGLQRKHALQKEHREIAHKVGLVQKEKAEDPGLD
jgi:hypothetical protein